MEKKMMGCALLAIGLMFSVVDASRIPSDDITCQEAVAELLPCQAYLNGSAAPVPPPACCTGAEDVLKKATTPEIRKSLCVCFKKVGKDMGVDPKRAKALPDLCKMAVPVPIDPSVDCRKIGQGA